MTFDIRPLNAQDAASTLGDGVQVGEVEPAERHLDSAPRAPGGQVRL